MTTDYAARDNNAKVTFYVLLWKRNGITINTFDDYWRNVHGPVCSRLPGQYQYWQWHVAHNEGGIFPTMENVNYTSTNEDQFDGIAELTFKSVQDRQTWFDTAGILMDDEHNIFSKAIGYVTNAGNSITYVDRMPVGDPNGTQGFLKFHVMVRKSDGVKVEDFRKHMTDTFAKTVIQHDDVQKLRVHLFEPPDVSRPDAAGVQHSEPASHFYQAAYEIAFKNNLNMEHFFRSEQYQIATANQSKYIKQVSPFPERTAYTFVYNGKMALAGQRGSTTAELITRVGAINQLKDNILDLVLGKGVR